MEKTGDFFNQIAIISDLLENINLNADRTSITFYLEDTEFKRILDLVLEKSNYKININKDENDSFMIDVGEISVYLIRIMPK
jgi:hypothetical protein